MSPKLYIYLLLRTTIGVALSILLTAFLYGLLKDLYASFGVNL